MGRKVLRAVAVVEKDKDGKVVPGGRSQVFQPGETLPDWADKSVEGEKAFVDPTDEIERSWYEAGEAANPLNSKTTPTQGRTSK